MKKVLIALHIIMFNMHIFAQQDWQVLEYQIIFGSDTNYILTGAQSAYQMYWNKVTKLHTDALNNENYIALGWRYNKNYEGSIPPKIELDKYLFDFTLQ